MAYTSINAELHDAHERGRQHDRRPRIIPVPNVPPKAETPIPRSVRHTLVNRITRQNRQEFNPAIAALRAQMPDLRQQYQREVASAEGYTDLASEAVQDISLKGLHGVYKRQVASELANRAADIQQSAPILAQEARQNFQSERSDLQQKIIDAQIAKRQAISKETSSAFDTARTDLHSAAEAQASRIRTKNKATRSASGGGSGGDKAANRAERRQSLAAALHEVDRIIHLANNAEVKARLDNGEATADDWGILEELVRKAEGVDFRAAQRAILHTKTRFGY